MKRSAGILIYRGSGITAEVLLVHSSGREDIEPWSIPKGEFDPEMESPADAAVREVQEELGVTIKPEELQAAGEQSYRNRKKKVYGFLWECPDIGLEIDPDPFEIARFGFFGLDRARKMIHPDQVPFLDRLAGRLK